MARRCVAPRGPHGSRTSASHCFAVVCGALSLAIALPGAGAGLVLSFDSCVVERRYAYYETTIKCKGNPEKRGSTVQAELISLPTSLLFVQPNCPPHPTSLVALRFPKLFLIRITLERNQAGWFCLSLFLFPEMRVNYQQPRHLELHLGDLANIPDETLSTLSLV